LLGGLPISGVRIGSGSLVNTIARVQHMLISLIQAGRDSHSTSAFAWQWLADAANIRVSSGAIEE